ncbi:MAG: hypothetical protein H7Y86_04015 [Rhizobacter sp.]|nr:hypothetical protein [Ferruginibacter sp.]
MANPYKFYLAHMHDKSGFRASWDPSRVLKIGYVGKLDKFGVFTVFSSLEDEGIVPKIGAQGSKVDMDYTSHDSVSVSLKASGTAPVAGSALTELDAGFTIGFKGGSGVVFQTSGQRTMEIINMDAIQKQIVEKFNEGNWDQDSLIVTHLVEADTVTVIISNSSNGLLELKAKAGVGTANLKLTDATLGLTVAREQGSTMKFISQSGLTPLYRVMGLHHPLFKDWKLTPKGKGPENLSVQDFDSKEVEEDD